MKKRSSKNYLVIGNIASGWDDTILSTLSTVAEYHNAEVIHTGDICTYHEKLMYERRVNRIRTFEKNHEEEVSRRNTLLEKDIKSLEVQIKEAKEELDYSKENESEAKSRKWENKVDRLKSLREKWEEKLEKYTEKSESKINQMNKELKALVASQILRENILSDYFNNVKLVINNEQYINKPALKILGSHFDLGKYIVIQSVNANGKKISTQPITDRSFKYLKKLKKSSITPHPIPALRSFEREGEGQAWNMYTTGGLFISGDSLRPSEFHKAVNLPSALLVSVDSNNGEFHASRLHFDNVKCFFSKKDTLGVLHDGLLFTSDGTLELEGSDQAVGMTDTHAPYQDPKSMGAYKGLAILSQAETGINGGDINDWHTICPHNIKNPKERENKRLTDDFKAFEKITQFMSNSSPFIKKNVLVDANHEFWLTRFTDQHPELIGICDQKTLYEKFIKDWNYHIPLNGADYSYTWADITIRHGDKEALTKAVKLFIKYWAGHFHSHQEMLRCGSSGASCKPSPAYLGGNITGWQSCVTSFTQYNGTGAFDIKSVLGDNGNVRFSYRGCIYEVKEIIL